MNVLEIVKTGLEKSELIDLQKSLIKKRADLLKQINNREAAIKQMKDTDEIDFPVKKDEAETAFAEALISTTNEFDDVWSAYVDNKTFEKSSELENDKVAEYESELVELRGLLEIFPSVEEIKSLKLK